MNIKTSEGVNPDIPFLRMPSVLRYYDDYEDEYRVLKDPDTRDMWEITYDGSTGSINFSVFHSSHRQFVKRWAVFLLSTMSPGSARRRLDALRVTDRSLIEAVMNLRPLDAPGFWDATRARNTRYDALISLKSVLRFLCVYNVGDWAPHWQDLVSQLPLPKKDKYAAVRTGDVFLSVEEEAAIVRRIDDVVGRVQKHGRTLHDGIIRDTAILVCSYQYGFRPKQIGMLKMRDVKVWNDGLDAFPAVHLTFTMIKQRSDKRVFPLMRRIKREWACLFALWFARAQHSGQIGKDNLFRLHKSEVSVIIADQLESILGERRTATDLRHSAAQRLVDAGATEEEVAEFLGHSDKNTALIYFRSSRSQAERVNHALQISPIYRAITKIAHDRFITAAELFTLKRGEQIGALPHGIPITGIGG